MHAVHVRSQHCVELLSSSWQQSPFSHPTSPSASICVRSHLLLVFLPSGTSCSNLEALLPFFVTSPGYPLTSSTVYSPPPRPLPRSTFSRPAFNLKKPYKYCNWKCAALSAIVISVTLVILLAYFIGKLVAVCFSSFHFISLQTLP